MCFSFLAISSDITVFVWSIEDVRHSPPHVVGLLLPPLVEVGKVHIGVNLIVKKSWKSMKIHARVSWWRELISGKFTIEAIFTSVSSIFSFNRLWFLSELVMWQIPTRRFLLKIFEHARCKIKRIKWSVKVVEASNDLSHGYPSWGKMTKRHVHGISTSSLTLVTGVWSYLLQQGKIDKSGWWYSILS